MKKTAVVDTSLSLHVSAAVIVYWCTYCFFFYVLCLISSQSSQLMIMCPITHDITAGEPYLVNKDSCAGPACCGENFAHKKISVLTVSLLALMISAVGNMYSPPILYEGPHKCGSCLPFRICIPLPLKIMHLCLCQRRYLYFSKNIRNTTLSICI